MKRKAIQKRASKQSCPIHIFIIASRAAYQDAAGLAASTYIVQGNPSVTVLIPQRERVSAKIRHLAEQYRFQISKFPFQKGRPDNFVASLKCQAFVWTLAKLSPTETVAFVDADTCCLKCVKLSRGERTEILAGSVGIAADICDRHCDDQNVPWYLDPGERLTYVNSGVMFMSRQSLPFFDLVLKLSRKARFFIGPMQDQTVINFALGRHFRGGLVLLKKKLNTIEDPAKNAVILHFAGGAGLLRDQDRNKLHSKCCEAALRVRVKTKGPLHKGFRA